MNKITINGKTIKSKGTNISIINNKIIIDGITVENFDDYTKDIEITIEGNVNKLETTSGNVTVKGDVGEIETASGDIEIDGDCGGSIRTASGDVRCENVQGDVKTMSGDIRRK